MKDYHAHVSEAAAKNITSWLNEPKYAEYKSELEQLIEDENWQELEDGFYKVLEFGTAGRRGQVGIGSARLNRVTVGESAQALCEYALKDDPSAGERGLAVACDTRNSSDELSRYVAQVAAANGFKAYIFDGFRSTPELSFAVRELGCAVGVVITASHNPPEDNGFKAYWSDGAQLVAPHDKGVLDMAAKISTINALDDFDEAVQSGKIIIIDESMDQRYFEAVLAESLGTERDVKIVYSPLHGAGIRNTVPVLQQAGFDKLIFETEQMQPDGNFPTVEGGKSNPEEKAANDRAVALMLAENADIAITNDPDADRFGVMVHHQHDVVYLSGNQAAALATEFSLRKMKDSGALTPNHYLLKTIVTTDMMTAIGDEYGVKTHGNLLNGFKFIGDYMRRADQTDEQFVLGAEDSFGMLKGDYVRDKDGASGALVLAECAAEQKAAGKTLWDHMLALYEQYGLFVEHMLTIVRPGAAGFIEMQAMMKSLREQPPTELEGEPITAISDYLSLTRRDLTTDEVSAVDCVSGDVLVYELGEPSRRLTIRPSGTEPKVKVYASWRTDTDDAATDYVAVKQHLDTLCRALEGEALKRVQ